jgi:ribosomal protein S4E
MNKNENLKDGDLCRVIRGTHAGKSGIVRDVKTSKTGYITITVEQDNGARFKTIRYLREVIQWSFDGQSINDYRMTAKRMTREAQMTIE